MLGAAMKRSRAAHVARLLLDQAHERMQHFFQRRAGRDALEYAALAVEQRRAQMCAGRAVVTHPTERNTSFSRSPGALRHAGKLSPSHASACVRPALYSALMKADCVFSRLSALIGLAASGEQIACSARSRSLRCIGFAREIAPSSEMSAALKAISFSLE